MNHRSNRRHILVAGAVSLLVCAPIAASAAPTGPSEAEAEVEAAAEAEVGPGRAAGATSVASGAAAIGLNSRTGSVSSASGAISTTAPAPESVSSTKPGGTASGGTGGPAAPAASNSAESEIEAEAEVEVEAGNGAAVAVAGGGISGSSGTSANVAPLASTALDNLALAVLAETATDASTSPVTIDYVAKPNNNVAAATLVANPPGELCEMEGPQLECEPAVNNETESEVEAEAEAEAEMGAAAAGVSGAAGVAAVGRSAAADADLSTAVSTSTSDVTVAAAPTGSFNTVGESAQLEVAGALSPAGEAETEIEVEVEVEVANNAAAAAAVAGGAAGLSGIGSSAFVSASTSSTTSTENDAGDVVRNNDERAIDGEIVISADPLTTDAEVEAEAEATAETDAAGTPSTNSVGTVTATGDSTAEALQTVEISQADGSYGTSRTPANVALDVIGSAPAPQDPAAVVADEAEASAGVEVEAEVGFKSAAASAAAVGAHARADQLYSTGDALSATETNTRVLDNDANVELNSGRSAASPGSADVPAGTLLEVEAEAEAEAEVGQASSAAGSAAGFAGAPRSEDYTAAESITTDFAAASAAAAGPQSSVRLTVPDAATGTIIATATATDPDCSGVAVAVAAAGVGTTTDGAENEQEAEAEGECTATATVTVFIAGTAPGNAAAGTSVIDGTAPLPSNSTGGETEVELEVEAEAGFGVAAVSVGVAAAGRFPDVSTSTSTLTATPVGPIITSPTQPIRVTTDAGAPTATVTFDASAVDAGTLESVPVVCTPPSGSAFAIGTTTVTCSATDAAGNTVTSEFDVVVEDSEAPVIESPGDQMVAIVAGTSGPVEFAPATATDNSGSVSVTCTPPSGSLFEAGSSTIVCVATDASGNTATTQFNLTVVAANTELPATGADSLILEASIVLAGGLGLLWVSRRRRWQTTAN